MSLLEIPALGMRAEVSEDAASCEVLVSGRPRGFITQAHVHTHQTERHEVLEGSMRLVLDGVEHVLRQGEAMEVPPGTPHRQLATGDGRVRITLKPAGTTAAFMQRLADLSAAGGFNRFGF